MADLRIASFNLFWGTRAHTREPFDLVAACGSLDADVLLLQECFRHDGEPGQAADVAAALGYDEVLESPVMARSTWLPEPEAVPWARPEGAVGDWYLALLSRHGVRSRRVDRLPQLRLDGARRFVVTADLDVGGAAVTVATTHLPHLEMGAPLLTRALREALPPVDGPAVFAGDMNMWWWCLAAMTPRGWRRAVKGATWPARRPHSQIDHVLVTPSVEVAGGEVIDLVRSDHRPVRAVVRV